VPQAALSTDEDDTAAGGSDREGHSDQQGQTVDDPGLPHAVDQLWELVSGGSSCTSIPKEFVAHVMQTQGSIQVIASQG
jgi:hypothetical protein